jgi:hypothetical protein
MQMPEGQVMPAMQAMSAAAHSQPLAPPQVVPSRCLAHAALSWLTMYARIFPLLSFWLLLQPAAAIKATRQHPPSIHRVMGLSRFESALPLRPRASKLRATQGSMIAQG